MTTQKEVAMKVQHRVTLWAEREGQRTLEMEAGGPDAPLEAQRRVQELMHDPRVSTIELASHDLIDGGDGPRGAGGVRSWVRRGRRDNWRCVEGLRTLHPHRLI
jgi:hypothetical protein